MPPRLSAGALVVLAVCDVLPFASAASLTTRGVDFLRLRKVDRQPGLAVPTPSVEASPSGDRKIAEKFKGAGDGLRDRVARVRRPGVLKDVGVKFNKNDDWEGFLLAVLTNLVVMAGCCSIFAFFRQRYRLVYAKNVWDNWGYSEPEDRDAIVDGVPMLFEEKDFPVVCDAGTPLPSRPRGYFFDWMTASWMLKTKQIGGAVGLDQAMLIQFTNFAMTTFALIGIPMCAIVAPIHMTMGGNAAGDDYLSWQGFANVAQGSSLCWMHAFIVWFVVLATVRNIYKWQEKFVKTRVEWLKHMPRVQACSVLVEGIPDRCRTPAILREYFNRMFGGRDVIKEVHVMMHTSELMGLIATRDEIKTKLIEKRAKLKASGEDPNAARRPFVLCLFGGESLSELQRELAIAESRVKSERLRLRQKSEQLNIQEDDDDDDEDLETESSHPTDDPHSSDGERGEVLSDDGQLQAIAKGSRGVRQASTTSLGGQLADGLNLFAARTQTTKFVREMRGLYCDSAFVTFHTRYDACMAIRMVPFTPDREELKVTHAPDPADIVYKDFTTDRMHAKLFCALGYALLVGLAFVFLPTISFISAKSKTSALAEYFPIVGELERDYPKIASLWNGIAGALGLNIVLGFLPTMLVLITSSCFRLKAYAWAQQLLQRWYFMFLIIFQLFVVTISSSLEAATMDTIENPLSLIHKLSYGMCRTTHFFLSVFVIQWASVGMEVTRYIQLIKYILWKNACESPEEAHKFAEPEDQDYYGMGARTARYTCFFVIGLVFVSLCPLLCIIAFIYFLFIRLLIAYQVVFAETKKPDLGGEFWVTSMKHCQFGLLVYIMVMTAVLYERADSPYPAFVAGTSLLYWAEKTLGFDEKFFWESLSQEEVIHVQQQETCGQAHQMRQALRGTYMQPELAEDE
mmetsp:Transcript_54561/g.157836  ORF Transcript_54561/g.157836 Transcript_54561/m.157836 type:complete len:911 (+) Transcript_54561:150-2882(+)